MFKMPRRDATEIYYDEEYDIVVIRQENMALSEDVAIALDPRDVEIVCKALLEAAKEAGG